MRYALLFCAACGAATPSPAQERAVVNDLAEQADCVKNNATKEAIDACRAAVKAKRAP
jgi:hypothetical protein